jgi:hypothetical protein
MEECEECGSRFFSVGVFASMFNLKSSGRR